MRSHDGQVAGSTSRRLSAFLVYLIILAVLVSPQFSPFGAIGPDGILRGDQILIPFLIVLLVVVNRDRLRIPLSRISIGLFAITAAITTSLIINTIFLDLNPSAGELFDVLIWTTYTLMFMVVGGNLSGEIAERGFGLVLVLTIVIAIFAVLQAAGNHFAIETLGSVYTDRLSRLVNVAPTATTSNPNTLAKLVLIPLFAFAALAYRSITGNNGHSSLFRTILFGALAVAFGAIIVMSDSRSGLIAAMVGLGIVSLGFVYGRVGDDRRRTIILLAGTVLGITLVFLAIFVFEVGRIGNLQHLFQDSSLQRRFEKWNRIVPIILEQPIIGHGPAPLYQARVSFTHIDSGVLSWWYHYGLLGVVSYLYLVLGIVRLGLQGLMNVDLFQDRPILWSAAVAAAGWFSGTLAAWTVAGVPQSRRVFTFTLLIAVFVSLYYHDH